MGSFCSKYIRFELKNTEELSFMKLKTDAKLEHKNGMRNWVNFTQSTRKSEKLYFDEFFLFKAYNISARKFQMTCVMTVKGNTKLKGKLTCGL